MSTLGSPTGIDGNEMFSMDQAHFDAQQGHNRDSSSHYINSDFRGSWDSGRPAQGNGRQTIKIDQPDLYLRSIELFGSSSKNGDFDTAYIVNDSSRELYKIRDTCIRQGLLIGFDRLDISFSSGIKDMMM